MDRTSSHRRRAGYTLMEVLIAVALLALVLTTVLGTQAGSVQVGSVANERSIAMLLGRAKMLELESQLLADGFTENSETERGNFRSEGFGGFKWEATIDPVEIDEASQEALLSETNSQLFGAGDDGGGGTFTGNAAFASYLPMVVGMLPDFINRLGERIRKVSLVIKWESVRGEHQLVLVQYVTDLDSDDNEQQQGGGGAVVDPGLGAGGGAGP